KLPRKVGVYNPKSAVSANCVFQGATITDDRRDYRLSGPLLGHIEKAIEEAKAKVPEHLRPKFIHLKMLVKDNYLEFHTTTNTIFGSYADPKFRLTYDLQVNIVLPLTANLQDLRATEVTATLGRFTWKTKNVLVAIKAFFEGTGFITNAIKGKSF